MIKKDDYDLGELTELDYYHYHPEKNKKFFKILTKQIVFNLLFLYHFVAYIFLIKFKPRYSIKYRRIVIVL